MHALAIYIARILAQIVASLIMHQPQQLFHVAQDIQLILADAESERPLHISFPVRRDEEPRHELDPLAGRRQHPGIAPLVGPHHGRQRLHILPIGIEQTLDGCAVTSRLHIAQVAACRHALAEFLERLRQRIDDLLDGETGCHHVLAGPAQIKSCWTVARAAHDLLALFIQFDHYMIVLGSSDPGLETRFLAHHR